MTDSRSNPQIQIILAASLIKALSDNCDNEKEILEIWGKQSVSKWLDYFTEKNKEARLKLLHVFLKNFPFKSSLIFIMNEMPLDELFENMTAEEHITALNSASIRANALQQFKKYILVMPGDAAKKCLENIKEEYIVNLLKKRVIVSQVINPKKHLKNRLSINSKEQWADFLRKALWQNYNNIDQIRNIWEKNPEWHHYFRTENCFDNLITLMKSHSSVKFITAGMQIEKLIADFSPEQHASILWISHPNQEIHDYIAAIPDALAKKCLELYVQEAENPEQKRIILASFRKKLRTPEEKNQAPVFDKIAASWIKALPANSDNEKKRVIVSKVINPKKHPGNRLSINSKEEWADSLRKTLSKNRHNEPRIKALWEKNPEWHHYFRTENSFNNLMALMKSRSSVKLITAGMQIEKLIADFSLEQHASILGSSYPNPEIYLYIVAIPDALTKKCLELYVQQAENRRQKEIILALFEIKFVVLAKNNQPPTFNDEKTENVESDLFDSFNFDCTLSNESHPPIDFITILRELNKEGFVDPIQDNSSEPEYFGEYDNTANVTTENTGSSTAKTDVPSQPITVDEPPATPPSSFFYHLPPQTNLLEENKQPESCLSDDSLGPSLPDSENAFLAFPVYLEEPGGSLLTDSWNFFNEPEPPAEIVNAAETNPPKNGLPSETGLFKQQSSRKRAREVYFEPSFPQNDACSIFNRKEKRS